MKYSHLFNTKAWRWLALAAVLLAQRAAFAANPYLVETFEENGQQIDKIIVPGRPPAITAEAVSLPVPNRQAGVNTLSAVPAFTWCYGCSATSAGMMMGYYDNHGYANMYTGSANGGLCPMNNETYWGSTPYPNVTCGECPLVASHNGKDGRLTRGHVDEYWIDYLNPGPDPYLVYGWAEHTPGDCTADFMGTSQSKYGNQDGSTMFYSYTDGSPLGDYTGCEPGERDGCHGMKLFVNARGYTVTTNFSQYIYGYNGNPKGFTYTDFKNEIDAGRPVMIQVLGHSMVGLGYNDTGSLIYLHDTWDHNNHSMTWGGSYSDMQHYGVVVLRLAPIELPTVTVTATDASAGEPSDPGTFTFSRSGSVDAALTVNFTVGGTATSGSDYVSLGTSVTLAAGAATATKTVSVLDDTAVEGNETVVLTLASGTGYTLGSPASATVTIADNDTAPAIAVSPSSQDFGFLQVNTTADRTFYVTNSGGGLLSGSATAADPFSMVLNPNYTLPGGAFQAVVVRYSPKVAGTNNATVSFSGGGGATRPVTGAAYGLLLTGMTCSNGVFRCRLNGPVGSTYLIQYSADLLHWWPMLGITVPAGGSVQFTDRLAGQSPRFYQAVPQLLKSPITSPPPPDK